MAGNLFEDLSKAMADAVEAAGAYTVMVDGRRRLPATGIAYEETYVLTADHVLERDEEIGIGLGDGSRLTARVAGRDPGSDIALLAVDGGTLAPARRSAPARVGQLALALGRPNMQGLRASLGVISSSGGPARTWRGGSLESYLRTDAAPLPGFSGGPLIDAAGMVIGLNTSGLTRGDLLTIPYETALQTAKALREHGRIRRGYLGIRSQPVGLSPAQQESLGREQESGLLIVGVESGGPAEQGGLLVGDILVAINDQPVRDADDLQAHLGSGAVGGEAKLGLLRGGKPEAVGVTIGERE